LEDSSVPPNRAFYKVEATPIFSTIGSESTQAALQLELLDFEDIEPEEMQSIEGKIYWPVSDCNCASSEHE